MNETENPEPLRRFNVRIHSTYEGLCTAEYDCPGGTYVLATDALALQRENQKLRERLECNRCNAGHETLPLKLWDCPACVEERETSLRAERDALRAQVARLRDALRDVAEWAHGTGAMEGEDIADVIDAALAETEQPAHGGEGGA